MNQYSYKQDFARYTILSVLGTLGVSCYILADTFFVSKGLGTRGLTALNLAIPIYNFIHGTGLMLGMGGATKFSICKGQNQYNEGHKIYTHTIILAIVFSIIFMFIGLLRTHNLAIFLGADTDTLEMTKTYLFWLLIFAPAFILNDVLLCFVRNDGSPQLSMIAMLIGSFSNIILDYVFIFPMKMGIFGAILATGLSPLISIMIMTLHWIKKKNTFSIVKTRIQINMIKQELSLGFPSFIAQLSSGIVMITFNTIILQLTGNIGVAAYGIIANISLVIVAVYTGIAQGVQPLISTFYGKGNDQQTKIMLRYAILTMLVVSFIIYLLIYIFALPITAIFNSEGSIELQDIAIKELKLYFTSIAFVGYNIILATFFTSIEKALPAHILSILRGLVLIIPMAYFMSSLFEMTGVWLTYPLTELIVALLGLVIYKNLERKERK